MLKDGWLISVAAQVEEQMSNGEFGFLGARAFSNELAMILVQKLSFLEDCHWLTSQRSSVKGQRTLSLAWRDLLEHTHLGDIPSFVYLARLLLKWKFQVLLSSC